MTFRFRLGLTLVALPALLILLSLGKWQVDRLAWKEALIAKVEARTQHPPIPLPDHALVSAALDYTPVQVQGVFDHSGEILMAGRSSEGQGGYMVLTPFKTDMQGWILVQRGFVPPPFKDAATRAQGQLSGLQTVTGLLQLPPKPGPFTPDNLPDVGQWYHIDLAVIEQVVGRDLYPVVLFADTAATPVSGWPRGGQARINFPNNHLGYVITWFGFAFALVVVWLGMSLQRRD